MAREVSNGINSKGPIQLSSGTASNAPLNFQAGTNLTTPAAGAVEYDGKVFYSTTSTVSGRGISHSSLIYRLNSNLAGNQTTSTQNSLGVSVTVASSTIYLFEFNVVYTKTVGTNVHDFIFSRGGTATVNNLAWVYMVPAYTAGGVTYSYPQTTWTSTFTYSSISTASLSLNQSGRGTISINTGGTLNLNYRLSFDPGGAYSTVAGSYFMLTPIGAAGANISVGSWV